MKVSTAMGLAAGILARLPDWNWWGFSTGFTATTIVDLALSWSLAGLVIVTVIGQTRRT